MTDDREEVGYQAQFAGSDSKVIYDYWFDLYRLLVTLPLNRAEVRHAPETLAMCHAAKWQVSADVVDQYWHRVSWIADRCRGRVLEIGSAMGNVTRWIAENPSVTSVLAVEVQPRYAEALKQFAFPKVDVLCGMLESGTDLGGRQFDTVVMAELIEHLTVRQERALVSAVRRHLAPGATWVVTTPIGFMPDPDHKRGFGPRWFLKHADLLYGTVVSHGDNKIQHFVECRDRGSSVGSRLRGGIGGLLDTAFQIRPSGMSAAARYQPVRLVRRAFSKINRAVRRTAS